MLFMVSDAMYLPTVAGTVFAYLRRHVAGQREDRIFYLGCGDIGVNLSYSA